MKEEKLEGKSKFPWSVAIWSGLGTTAVALVAAFSLGWITTTGSALQKAEKRAETAVVDALTPVCVAVAQRDPLFTERSAELLAATSYKRRGMVDEYTWANVPGVESPSTALSNACADAVVEFVEAEAAKVVAEATT